jgi:hypothetical protein
MNRKTVVRCITSLLLAGACLALGLTVSMALAEPDSATVTSIKGTCTFKDKDGAWSAQLKAKGDGTYDAVYVSSWGDISNLNYIGTIKTDLKTEISGTGKAVSGGRANGSFEFAGTYGTNNIAQCSYKEVSGNRTGSMTIEMAK